MPESKVALITGAGKGVGRATALQLALAGYRVALVARTASDLDAVANQIARQPNPPDTLAVPADLTDPAAPEQIVAVTLERFGRIDVLVNNAGVAVASPIAETSPHDARRMVELNLLARILLTRLVMPVMQRHAAGVIVNLSSLAAFDPFPGFGVYAATQTAVNMLTRITADEGRDHHITAVALALGAVETDLLRSLFDESFLPRDKTLDPADVAAVIVDCVTGKRPFKSGETIQLPSP